MDQIMLAVQEQVISLLGVVIIGAVGYVARYAKQYLEQKGILAKLENKQKYIRIVVQAVEQMYKEADGAKKLEVAKQKSVQFLNEKKINITDEELSHLVEAAVKEMKNTFK